MSFAYARRVRRWRSVDCEGSLPGGDDAEEEARAEMLLGSTRGRIVVPVAGGPSRSLPGTSLAPIARKSSLRDCTRPLCLGVSAARPFRCPGSPLDVFRRLRGSAQLPLSTRPPPPFGALGPGLSYQIRSSELSLSGRLVPSIFLSPLLGGLTTRRFLLFVLGPDVGIAHADRSFFSSLIP